MYYWGGGSHSAPGPPLIACGGWGEGASTHLWPTYNQMHAGFSFSYPPISVLLRQPLSIKRAMQERYSYLFQKNIAVPWGVYISYIILLYIYCKQTECLNAIEILLYKGNAAQKNTGTKGYYKNKLFNLWKIADYRNNMGRDQGVWFILYVKKSE